MLKVVHDISILGISHRAKSVFGISRTTEELLYALLENTDIFLGASSDLSFDVWLNSREYLRHSDFKGNLHWKSDTQNALLRAKFDRITTNLLHDLQEYKILKSGYTLNKWKNSLVNWRFSGLSPRSITDIDIYHSPFHVIPNIILECPNIKQVLTVHDTIPIIYPQFCGMPNGFDKTAFHPEFNLPKALDAVTPDTWISCPSTATKVDLCDYLKHRVDPNKIFIVPWAASNLFYACQDSEKHSLIRQKYKIPEGPYILSLNTLEPRKNIDHLIRCFVNLVIQEQISDLSLVLAGPLGWQYDSILGEIKKNPTLANRLILTGYVANEDLASLYSHAMVFVYPSFYEGFGLPPLEAMQCGTPVITSNTSSLPEVIGDAGIALDPRSQTDLCANLLKFYQSSSLREELSQKSLTRSQQFSWRKCAEQTMEIYRQAIA